MMLPRWYTPGLWECPLAGGAPEPKVPGEAQLCGVASRPGRSRRPPAAGRPPAGPRPRADCQPCSCREGCPEPEPGRRTPKNPANDSQKVWSCLQEECKFAEEKGPPGRSHSMSGDTEMGKSLGETESLERRLERWVQPVWRDA